MSRRILLRIGIGLLAAFMLLVLVLALFDWNQAKPWLNERVSEATGRPFAINGDLSLDWQRGDGQASGWRSWVPWPHLTAGDITFGNPDWARDSGNMAEVGQLSFSLNPLALLARQIAIPLLQLNDARLELLRSKDGKSNWTMQSSGEPSRWRVELGEIHFRNGTIHLVDPIRQIDATATIDTLDPDQAGPFRISWKLSGSMERQEVSGSGKAGALLALREQRQPFPLEMSLKVGETQVIASGTVTGLPQFEEADLQVELSGNSMAHLYPLTGVLLPHTPRFSTKGQLQKAGQKWSYSDFSGQVGDSDLAGDFIYETKEPRPLLQGNLVSRELRLQDLGPLIGSGNKKNLAKGDENEKQPSGKALPVRDFDTSKWKVIDADVKFRGKKIVRDEDLPFEDIVAHLKLQNGALSLAPLNFGLAGGKLASNVRLNASEKSIRAELDLSARGLKLKRLFPEVDLMKASIGEVHGDAKLTASGDSVAGMLASSNGEVKALINEGTVSKLLLEQVGLNIGSIILTRLFGDRPVNIHCMAADFAVNDGVMRSRGFVFDTDESIITINGSINLAQEKLDLVIHPQNRRLRLFSLRSPLYVQGSFKDPDIGIDKKTVAAKAGGALVLGLAAPVATALLPLINPGENQNSGCHNLLQQASQKPTAPAPPKDGAKNRGQN